MKDVALVRNRTVCMLISTLVLQFLQLLFPELLSDLGIVCQVSSLSKTHIEEPIKLQFL